MQWRRAQPLFACAFPSREALVERPAQKSPGLKLTSHHKLSSAARIELHLCILLPKRLHNRWHASTRHLDSSPPPPKCLRELICATSARSSPAARRVSESRRCALL